MGKTVPEVLKERYQRAYKREAVEQLLAYYTPLGIKPTENGENEVSEAVLNAWLNADPPVLVIMGESGGGKTTLAHALEKQLWSDYENQKIQRIPLRIHLAEFTTENIKKGLVETIAKYCRIKAEEVDDLRNDYAFILILDGYDEGQWDSQKPHPNLYRDTDLNDWDVKILITCRQRFFRETTSFQAPFAISQHCLAEMRYLALFTPEQIKTYITQYKPTEAGAILTLLKQDKPLAKLVRTPIILNLFLRSYSPQVYQNDKKLNRWLVYETFLADLFSKQQQHEKIAAGEFEEARIHFEAVATDLALKLFSEGKETVASTDLDKKSFAYQAFFKDKNPWVKAVREGYPLRKIKDNVYGFVHKSFIEHFVAKHWLSFLTENKFSESLVIWSKTNLAEHRSVLMSLREAIESSPEKPYLQQLWMLVKEAQKSQPGFSGSNALTLLKELHESLNNQDFSHLYAPGVDLSCANLDHANFTKAILIGANLSHSNLRYGRFANATLKDVFWGQLPFLKFDGIVTAMAYSPNGLVLAVAVFGKLTYGIHFIHPLTGESENSFILIKEWVQYFCFCQDSNYLAIAQGKSISIWDRQSRESWECTVVLQGHTNEITSLCYSPVGQQLASGSKDKTIRLWSVESDGWKAKVLEGHTGDITCLCYSRNGEQLASGSSDGSIRLWPLTGGSEEVIVLNGYKHGVKNVCYSPDGKQLASSESRRRDIYLWSLTTYRCEKKILKADSTHINVLTYSPTGEQLASGGGDGNVRLWSLKTYQQEGFLRPEKSITREIVDIRYHPLNEKQLAIRELGAIVHLHSSRTLLPERMKEHQGGIDILSGHPASQQFVSSSCRSVKHRWNNVACLWSAKTFQCEAIFKTPFLINYPIFSANGKLLFLVSKRDFKLWSISECRYLLQSAQYANNFHYLPHYHQIAWVNSEQIRLRSIIDDQDKETIPIPELPIPGLFICGTCCSPDGQHIAVLFCNKVGQLIALSIWSMETHQYVAHLTYSSDSFFPQALLRLIYSPAGQQLVVVDEEGNIRFWSIETKSCQRVNTKMNVQSSGVQLFDVVDLLRWMKTHRRIAYSPNGRYLAFISAEKTVEVWSTTNYQCQLTLPGEHEGFCYDQTGEHLITWNRQGMVSLWCVQTRECIQQLSYHKSGVTDIVELAARTLITAGKDGALAAWKPPPLNSPDNHWHLVWCTHPYLLLEGMDVQGAKELTPLDQLLLKQGGAVNVPEFLPVEEESFQDNSPSAEMSNSTQPPNSLTKRSSKTREPKPTRYSQKISIGERSKKPNFKLTLPSVTEFKLPLDFTTLKKPKYLSIPQEKVMEKSHATSSKSVRLNSSIKNLLLSQQQMDNDESLAQGGEYRTYQYSWTDLIALMHCLRQKYFSEVALNEPYSAYRENPKHIFLADTYLLETFAESFLEDMQIICGQHADPNRAWKKRPNILLLPILCGSHWCCLRITLDYEKKTCNLLWDDPYGHGKRWKNNKELLISGLKPGLALLLNQELSKMELPKPRIKRLDQQGSGENDYDCGPILVANLEDYLNAGRPNSHFTEKSEICPYTLPCVKDVPFEVHDVLIVRTRSKHIQWVRGGTSTPAFEENIKAGRTPKSSMSEKNLGLPEDIYQRLLQLPPAKIEEFFKEAHQQRKARKKLTIEFVQSLLVQYEQTAKKKPLIEITAISNQNCPFKSCQALANYYMQLTLFGEKDKTIHEERLKIRKFLPDFIKNITLTEMNFTDFVSLIFLGESDVTNQVLDKLYQQLESPNPDKAYLLTATALAFNYLVYEEQRVSNAREVFIVETLVERTLEYQKQLGQATPLAVLQGLQAISYAMVLLVQRNHTIGEAVVEKLKPLLKEMKENLSDEQIMRGYPGYSILMKVIELDFKEAHEYLMRSDREKHFKKGEKAVVKAGAYGVGGIFAVTGGAGVLAGALAATILSQGPGAVLLPPAIVGFIAGCAQGAYATYKVSQEGYHAYRHWKKWRQPNAPLSSDEKSEDASSSIWDVFLHELQNRHIKEVGEEEVPIIIAYLAELLANYRKEIPKAFMQFVETLFQDWYGRYAEKSSMQSLILSQCDRLHRAGYTQFPALPKQKDSSAEQAEKLWQSAQVFLKINEHQVDYFEYIKLAHQEDKKLLGKFQKEKKKQLGDFYGIFKGNCVQFEKLCQQSLAIQHHADNEDLQFEIECFGPWEQSFKGDQYLLNHLNYLVDLSYYQDKEDELQENIRDYKRQILPLLYAKPESFSTWAKQMIFYVNTNLALYKATQQSKPLFQPQVVQTKQSEWEKPETPKSEATTYRQVQAMLRGRKNPEVNIPLISMTPVDPTPAFQELLKEGTNVEIIQEIASEGEGGVFKFGAIHFGQPAAIVPSAQWKSKKKKEISDNEELEEMMPSAPSALSESLNTGKEKNNSKKEVGSKSEKKPEQSVDETDELEKRYERFRHN